MTLAGLFDIAAQHALRWQVGLEAVAALLALILVLDLVLRVWIGGSRRSRRDAREQARLEALRKDMIKCCEWECTQTSATVRASTLITIYGSTANERRVRVDGRVKVNASDVFTQNDMEGERVRSSHNFSRTRFSLAFPYELVAGCRWIEVVFIVTVNESGLTKENLMTFPLNLPYQQATFETTSSQIE